MAARLAFVKFVAALGACLVLGACDSIGIKADAAFASFAMSGDIGLAPTPNAPVVSADVENELGLSSRMSSPYGRVEAEFWIASATVSGFAVDQSGTGTLNNQFGNLVGSVSTDIDIKNVKGSIHFDLIDLGVVRISPGIGVDVFDLDLRARTINQEESVAAIAPVPMVFLQGELDVDIVEVVLDIGGMYAPDIADASGRFLDLELVVRVEPIDHFHVFLGYRHILIDVEGKSNGQAFRGDLMLSGFMFGGGVRF